MLAGKTMIYLNCIHILANSVIFHFLQLIPFLLSNSVISCALAELSIQLGNGGKQLACLFLKVMKLTFEHLGLTDMLYLMSLMGTKT